MYTLTYIYTPIYQNQAICVAKLCFYYFYYKKYHINASSRDLDFDLEFLRKPYIYVSFTSMQNL